MKRWTEGSPTSVHVEKVPFRSTRWATRGRRASRRVPTRLHAARQDLSTYRTSRFIARSGCVTHQKSTSTGLFACITSSSQVSSVTSTSAPARTATLEQRRTPFRRDLPIAWLLDLVGAAKRIAACAMGAGTIEAGSWAHGPRPSSLCSWVHFTQGLGRRLSGTLDGRIRWTEGWTSPCRRKQAPGSISAGAGFNRGESDPVLYGPLCFVLHTSPGQGKDPTIHHEVCRDRARKPHTNIHWLSPCTQQSRKFARIRNERAWEQENGPARDLCNHRFTSATHHAPLDPGDCRF